MIKWLDNYKIDQKNLSRVHNGESQLENVQSLLDWMSILYDRKVWKGEENPRPSMVAIMHCKEIDSIWDCMIALYSRTLYSPYSE